MERYTSLTKERLLNFKARVNESSVIKILTFLNSDGTGRDISGKGWEIPVKKIPGASTNLFKLTEGDGLTVQGLYNHQLAVFVSASRATQNPNTYFGTLYSSVEDKTWLDGDWEFHNGKYDGVIETDSITIYESGGDVTIVVSESGVSQSELTVALALKADLNTRSISVASTATLTPNVSNYDMAVITAQAEALTIANPTGTPVNGNGFVIRIKDNVTARAITFGNKYRAIGSALPTTTTISKTLYFAFVYNSADDKYDVFPSQLEV